MKSVKNFFKNPATFLFVMAFSLGCLSHYFIMANGLMASEEQNGPEKVVVKDLFKDDFITPLKGLHPLGLNVSEREDDDFKYFDILVDGQDKEGLKIDITNGAVLIESKMNQTKEEKKENFNTYSSFSSHLNQSFSVPDGVDEKKAEIIRKGELLTIKFPKVKMMI